MPRRNNVTTENRRVKYSKKLIQDSLLQLLQEKPLEKITVKELCERADVNRGTFYRYYEDIFDLFETIEQSLGTNFENHAATMHTQGLVPFLTELLHGAEKNRDLVIILSSLTPVAADCEEVDNETINTVNGYIAAAAEANDVYYLDAAYDMADSDGNLPANLTDDGMHLNADGVKNWLDIVMTHVPG